MARTVWPRKHTYDTTRVREAQQARRERERGATVTTLAEYEDAEHERERIERSQPARDAFGRFMKVCWSCIHAAPDGPSGLCPGCQAYREHLR